MHDGVLQVLAYVRRRGNEIGGAATELADKAGEQEVALRVLISEQGLGADSDAGPEDRTSGAPTEAPGAATPERPRTQVRLGPPSDHETAEITPLVGDDGDDVVPPSPRR